MESSQSVRIATPDDAECLAELHLRCWHETYSGLLSSNFFATHRVEVQLAIWSDVLNGPHARRHVVACAGGNLLGFAGSVPRNAASPNHAELWGLYLLRAHHGSGLGQQLLDGTLGDEPAALWVAEDNPRAQAFYRRNGFEFVGSKEEVDDWEGLVEVRMTRLGPGRGSWPSR